MEKYSKWRDQKSGIHPFIPIKVNTYSDQNVVKILKVWLVGPILVIVRLPFIILLTLWLFFMTGISALIPLSIIKRFFIRYTQAMGVRVLLFFLGFYWVNTRYVKLGRNTRIPQDLPGSSISGGDLILSNHTSYVDILYLCFRFSPIFAVPPNTWKDEPPKGIVVPLSNIFSALWFSIAEPEYTSEDGVPLKELLQKAKEQGNPLVVFPEGCASNGKTVLSCVPILEGTDIQPSKIHLLGLKYDFDNFSPSFSVGSFILHFGQLCAQLYNNLEVRYLPNADIPPLEDTHSFPIGDEQDILEGSWGEKVCGTLASLLRLKRANLNSKDKKEFKSFWYGHKRSYKKE